jgi:Tol biopolymer transport system component
MGKRIVITVVGIAAMVTLAVGSLFAGPNRFGFSDRVERHMFPEVTTGPAEPAWSPDGQWIAFSMQGDIWKVPAGGGEAIALTQGPAYHFEPDWSPDGRSLALTMDVGGNLEIGVVPADGGAVRRLASDPAVDLGPVWARDGQSILFVSSRNRGFDILRVALVSEAVTPVATGQGDQIQPAVSPDGTTLAFVATMRSRNTGCVRDGRPTDRRLSTGPTSASPTTSQ